jgi:hypothetical protein
LGQSGSEDMPGPVAVELSRMADAPICERVIPASAGIQRVAGAIPVLDINPLAPNLGGKEKGIGGHPQSPGSILLHRSCHLRRTQAREPGGQQVGWVERSGTYQWCSHALCQTPGLHSAGAKRDRGGDLPLCRPLATESEEHHQTPCGTLELNPKIPPSAADRCRGLVLLSVALEQRRLGLCE